MGVAYSALFARPQRLAATHLSSQEVGNGLSWPGQAAVHMQCQVTSHAGQAQHRAPTREYYAVIQRA